MTERNFQELLQAKWDQGKFVCIGLDSDVRSPKFPECMKHVLPEVGVINFNRAIIEQTKDLVCAYKPNSAFYERLGRHGIRALQETINAIHEAAPDVPVILDYKRGDIETTNDGYVEAAFDLDDSEVDAVTVHPYLGAQAMKPFLGRANKGVFVLCRTSNKGAGEFQDLKVTPTDEDFARICQGQPAELERFAMPKTMPLYQYVAYSVTARSTGWNANGNCGLVVGATYPEELAQVREIARDMPILIPGIGAQGGDLEKTIAAGKDSRGRGMIINSSRGIIFASSGPDFAAVARREAIALNDKIRACLEKEAV